MSLSEKELGPECQVVATLLTNLAALCETRGDSAQAEALAHRAIYLLEKARRSEQPATAVDLASTLAAAQQLRDGADKLYREGNYAAAISLEKRALDIRLAALGPEHLDVAGSLNDVAQLYAMTGEYARAEPLHQRALAIRERALGPDHADVAASLNNLASLYDHKGDHARAEPLHRRALAIRERALGPEHPAVANSLNNLAALHSDKGDYTTAELLFQRSLSIMQKTLGPDHPDVALSLNNLASLYDARGDHVRAEPLHRRALAIWEKSLGPEHPHVAGSLHNLAALYRAKGDYATAETLSQRSLSILEKALGPDHPHVATALSGLAHVYRMKREDARAEPLLQRALRIREQVLGPEHPDVATMLDNIAVLYKKKWEHAEAEPLHRRALAIREKTQGPDHPDVSGTLHNLASLYEAKGDFSKAEALYQRALAIGEKTLGPEHPDVAKTLLLLSIVYLARDEPLKAMQSIGRAAAIQDRNAMVLLSTGSDEQKWAYMATLRCDTDVAISLHVQFAPDVQQAKRLALTTILNRKGRGLDAMTDSFTALRRLLSAADQERLDRLRAVSAQYSALVWRGPGDAPPHDYRTSLARLAQERQQLEADISRRGVELQGALLPVTIEHVQEAIPEGAALVELFWYQGLHPWADRWVEPRYVAYVLTRRGEVAWVDLGEAAPIEAAVEALLPTLGRAPVDPRPAARDLDDSSEAGGDPRRAARELDALVMQPIRRLLGPTRRILLSPDGPLNVVPFGALVDEEGRYLVERYVLTYVASGRDLLRLPIRATARQDPVVIAAPDYDSPATAAAPASDGGPRSDPSAGVGRRQFHALHFAAEEGRAIARRLPGSTLLTGADATERAVKGLAGPELLHIATHGFYLAGPSALDAPPPEDLDAGLLTSARQARLRLSTDDPLLRSGIALAGANRRNSDGEDGILTALEVSQLDLTGTKLMVLSACETGVGYISNGDGVYGLRRAMVMAGAETQVMSLWSVDDAATRELMEAYYERLLDGGGRGDALRQAQLEMLRRPDRAHPYYWASFIVSGDPAAMDGEAPHDAT
ncbi:CHAT domain-containing tetratricopeptide repeat protein [Sorangium sp. So ce1078]